MWHTNYISEIQRQFVEVYGFPRRAPMSGYPETKREVVPKLGSVPDGTYPMTIEGKVDKVRVVDGTIHCLNIVSPYESKRKLAKLKRQGKYRGRKARASLLALRHPHMALRRNMV